MDDREYELKQLELTLKSREVAAREREVDAKEKESYVTWWKNPLIVGLIGAALALGGNIITNILSNAASADAEHRRAQADLFLSVIKTGGNEVDACKNLDFFVRIGQLDDPNGTIHTICGTKGKDGVPTLPAATISGSSGGGYGQGGYGQGGYGGGILIPSLSVRVEDADSHEPIQNALVAVGNMITGPASTDANGIAMLTFVFSSENLSVGKDGYETMTEPLNQTGVTSSALAVPIIAVDLHRARKSK
jgi:hypothetical protein